MNLEISKETNINKALKESKKNASERLLGGKGRVLYCPSCKLYTNHLFLRLQDRMSTQAIGYSCEHCGGITAAMERNQFTGEIVKRYVAPGFKL